MLKKNNRISNRRLLQKLIRKGRLYKNTYFIFKFLPSNLQTSQFAVSVSKKVSPKATDRNKIRRQVYESIYSNLELLTSNIIAIVIVKPIILEKKSEYKEIEKTIKNIFKKIHNL